MSEEQTKLLISNEIRKQLDLEVPKQVGLQTLPFRIMATAGFTILLTFGALAFVGFKGDKGEQGIEGKQGTQGEQGNGGEGVEAGTIMAFGGTKVPEGWTLCDGKLLRHDFEDGDLFDAIGHAWGTPAEQQKDRFKVPDLRGMFLRGAYGDKNKMDPGGRTNLPAEKDLFGVGSLQASKSMAIDGTFVSAGPETGPLVTAATDNLARCNPDEQVLYSCKPKTPVKLSVKTAPQNYPVNAAVNWIIKY